MEGSSTYEPAQCHNAAVSDSSSLSDEFESEREPPLTPRSPSVFDLASVLMRCTTIGKPHRHLDSLQS